MKRSYDDYGGNREGGGRDRDRRRYDDHDQQSGRGRGPGNDAPRRDERGSRDGRRDGYGGYDDRRGSSRDEYQGARRDDARRSDYGSRDDSRSDRGGYNDGGGDRGGYNGGGGGGGDRGGYVDRGDRAGDRTGGGDRGGYVDRGDRAGDRGGYGDRGDRGGDRNNRSDVRRDQYSRGGRDDFRDGGGRGRGGYGGRDGGRGGGGDRSRGRGGGRGGGRGRGPDLSGLTSCISNIILADVTPGFQFSLYSVSCVDARQTNIDSRHRRRVLFQSGLWDGLFKDMPDKEKEDWKRVIFFNGSFFYSARPIPGLEHDKLPFTFPLDPKIAEGDTFCIQKFSTYLAPVELQQGMLPLVGKTDVSFDLRCADCTKAFTGVSSMMQHCQQQGHKPVFLEPDVKTTDIQAKPALLPVFTAYVNSILDRALGERLARWGSEFIDPNNSIEPRGRDGSPMGVRVYEALSCSFGVIRPGIDQPAKLSLTVDLRAKVVRTKSMLENLCGDSDPNRFSPSRSEQERLRREFIGEIVIALHDKKCYSIVDLVFEHSPASLMVSDLGISHAQYFKDRRGIELKYPDARPIIAILGRRNETIYFPAELVAANELERRVKEQLPTIASYKPDQRNAAIEQIRKYLVPGAQKSKGAGGLLPGLGIILAQDRLIAAAQVMPVPLMIAAGVAIPKSRAVNWAPIISHAKFNVEANQINTLNVILVFNRTLKRGAMAVYDRIRDMVNKFNTYYKFGDEPYKMIEAGDREHHWGPVEQCMASEDRSNIFVLDFNKPRGGSDPAYSVVKRILASGGHLSQFVNFATYAHDNPRDAKRSSIILQGAARQILQKTGVRLWYVTIPRTLSTPTMFIGVDVFHAPRVYDSVAQKRMAKASCAAIIIQVIRDGENKASTIELYSETHAREAGKEYDLGNALRTTVSNALRELDVVPASCIVWRDGIGESAFDNAAQEEIRGIRDGLKGTTVGADGSIISGTAADVPLSYIVCQKRIDTKFLTRGVANEPDGKHGAPSGTLIKDVQGLRYNTFYINGRAPPYSTPKPVRFIVVEQDKELDGVDIPGLTWSMCHDYPNWTGPVKVPSVCQMAHKLAELGGGMTDCGDSIDAKRLKNTVHFL